MLDIMSLKRIGPYVGVSTETTIKYPVGSFHVWIYGAYDAFGLIGSECNGIAIADLRSNSMLLDGEAKVGTGWGGPAPQQIARFKEIKAMTWPEFQEFVNDHRNARHHI